MLEESEMSIEYYVWHTSDDVRPLNTIGTQPMDLHAEMIKLYRLVYSDYVKAHQQEIIRRHIQRLLAKYIP